MKGFISKRLIFVEDQTIEFEKRYNSIRITNIYPVVIKLWESNTNPFNFQPYYKTYRNSFGQIEIKKESVSKFLKRINENLTSEIKKAYLNRHDVLEKNYTHCKLEIVPYNNFNLLFLRSDNDLIFLNYTPIDIEFNQFDFIIPYFTHNRGSHIYDINGYQVINTHEPYINYCRLRLRVSKEELHKDYNQPFFSTFHLASIYGYEQINDNHGKCMEVFSNGLFTGMKFNYYVVDNIIIIYSFESNE